MNRRSVSKRVLAAGALFAGLATAPLQAAPADSLPSKVASSIASVVREKSGAVVRISCRDAQGMVVGTGFHIDPSGTVCTLAEIVRNGTAITVQRGSSVLPAEIVAIDPRSGVAFLKTQGSPSFLPPVTVTGAPAFTPVLGIGFPKGKEGTVPALGMISGTESHEGDLFFCGPHMLAGIPLCEGEGGAPVLDLSGGLTGIVISGSTEGGPCRILPAAAIEKLHRDLLRFGKLNPGWVGAMVEEAAVPVAHSRTRVAAVEQGSPAETAGIRPGDIILSLGEKKIVNPEEVLAASFYLNAGEPLRITLSRAGSVHAVTLRCALPPGSPEGSAEASPEEGGKNPLK